MVSPLADQLRSSVSPELCPDARVFADFLDRLDRGPLTRDEDPASHVCVYFTPFDSRTQRMFFIHHRKANLWLSPGGHIDAGESVLDALNRELSEELGIGDRFATLPLPSFCTITSVVGDPRGCREHHELWYFVPVSEHEVRPDMTEFLDTAWWSSSEAEERLIESNTRLAARRLAATHFTATFV